jgi:hypothetical protein
MLARLGLYLNLPTRRTVRLYIQQLGQAIISGNPLRENPKCLYLKVNLKIALHVAKTAEVTY